MNPLTHSPRNQLGDGKTRLLRRFFRKLLKDGKGISTERQQYDITELINSIRDLVGEWRASSEANWRVTPETARLLKHWRHHEFAGRRPFFCQVEAVETSIWLTEVAPHIGKRGSDILSKLATGNTKKINVIVVWLTTLDQASVQQASIMSSLLRNIDP